MTRDEIRAVYEAGPEAVITRVEQLLATMAALAARVQQLENRLATRSHNSSKPPSSDGFAKKTQSQPAVYRSTGSLRRRRRADSAERSVAFAHNAGWVALSLTTFHMAANRTRPGAVPGLLCAARRSSREAPPSSPNRGGARVSRHSWPVFDPFCISLMFHHRHDG